MNGCPNMYVRAATRGKTGKTAVLFEFCGIEHGSDAIPVICPQLWWSYLPKIYGGGPVCNMYYRAVVSRGAGGARDALAPPEFGSSVNPIPTRGGRLCPPQTAI